MKTAQKPRLTHSIFTPDTSLRVIQLFLGLHLHPISLIFNLTESLQPATVMKFSHINPRGRNTMKPFTARKGVIAILATFMTSMTSLSASTGNTIQCSSEGKAGAYPCSNVHLASEIDLSKSGLSAASGNDIWGWTDPDTGKEYALMGLSSKTAFVDVTNPEAPEHIGDLPTATSSSVWRDIKVYKNHAFIVSEAYNHGMQVFDLTRLRNAAPGEPREFKEDVRYKLFGSAHNIVINEDSGFAYAVGSDTCQAGMHVVDIRKPKSPSFSTCIDREIFDDVGNDSVNLFHGEDYTHDAQCVIYKGPDVRYTGRELCFCSNADTVNVVDVSDKSAPFQIAVSDYPGLGYTHQGWLSEDQRYFFLGDELDETKFGHPTKTLIWDMKDIHAPKLIGTYFSTELGIDHNLYVRGNVLVQANYDAGLRLLSTENVASGELVEIGFFDTEPTKNKAQFQGAWSVYPYFKSKNIIVSNIDGRLFVLTPSSFIASKF